MHDTPRMCNAAMYVGPARSQGRIDPTCTYVIIQVHVDKEEQNRGTVNYYEHG
jgi:hypothetical protein